MNDTKCQDFMEDSVEVITLNDGTHITHHTWTISMEEFIAKVDELAKKTHTFEITDNLGLERALDFAAEVVTVKSRIEAYRKEICKPHRQVIQNVNDYAKRLTDTLDQIKVDITIKLAEWQQKQELASLKAKEEAKKLSETLGINLDIMAPGVNKTLSSSKASTVCREKYSFEIMDEKLVPLEYWVIDEKLIQKHIDMGKREIPGVKFIVEKNLTIRRR